MSEPEDDDIEEDLPCRNCGRSGFEQNAAHDACAGCEDGLDPTLCDLCGGSGGGDHRGIQCPACCGSGTSQDSPEDDDPPDYGDDDGPDDWLD